MTGVVLGERLLVPRLEPVVELLRHARSQLVDQCPSVEALERERREHAVEDLGIREVGRDRFTDPGVLHLDRDGAAVARDGSVDLADRGCCCGLRRPVQEDPLRIAAELLAHDLGGEAGSHRGCIGLEGRQCLLRLLGERLDDEADQLTGLHQRALHLTELAGHVLRRADRRSRLEFGAAFRARHPPERPRADDPHAVADGQANDGRSPLEADPLLRGPSDPASSDGDRAADGGHPRGRGDHRAPFHRYPNLDAAAVSSSRNDGSAIETSARARCAIERPRSSATPHSVTT